jgi:hypothetical protein
MEMRMVILPTLDIGVFGRGVVFADQMDLLVLLCS